MNWVATLTAEWQQLMATDLKMEELEVAVVMQKEEPAVEVELLVIEQIILVMMMALDEDYLAAKEGEVTV